MDGKPCPCCGHDDVAVNLAIKDILEQNETLRAERSDHAAEVERLTQCLAKANVNHEEFERRYYLEADKVERLTAELDFLRAEADRLERDFNTASLSAERTAAERDAAVARAERAESTAVLVCNIVDRLRRKFEIQRNVNFNGAYVVQQFVYAKEELVAALAAAPAKPQVSPCDSCKHKDLRLDTGCAAYPGKDDCPKQQYADLSPEPWGGPEGDEE